MRNFRGFTLVELMVASLVAAVVAVMALHAWAHAVLMAHLGAARSELSADLTRSMAQSTAQSDRLVFCPSRDGHNCVDSFDWSEGWIAFTAPDENRRPGPDSQVVAKHGPVNARVRILTSTGRRSILFQSGGTTIGSNVTFTFCDRGNASALETLVISNSGRVRWVSSPDAQAAVACAAPSRS